MATAEEMREASDKLQELATISEEEEGLKEELSERLGNEIKLSFLSTGHVLSEYEEIQQISKNLNMNLTDARKQLTYPNEYVIDGQSIPDLVKKMRLARRELKGEQKDKMSKAIDNIIDAYSDHIMKCIDSIHWLKPYKHPLLKMNFTEKHLRKMEKMKSVEERRSIVDTLCKFWEKDLQIQDMAYSEEYAQISKEMKVTKKQFRDTIAKINVQKITKSKRELVQEFVLKSICENRGIGAKRIHDMMPNNLYKHTNSNMISKMVRSMDVINDNGSYYKAPSLMKKNIWAYCAAFIDSDGYITLDRNMNPRVGMVATGQRGRVFMEEMHKSIGFGRMHLDQKSPQNTRLINRLNFYSQDDVTSILTKCLPHFRLKKGNANLLLELIRMKKSYKKADWYKDRCDEIFKLMKWENHKYHVGFDWAKENIYLDDIAKLQGNCKMSLMDEMENIGGIVLKEE